MQKAINFYNGYSNVQDDLNYQVISKEQFTHKNMTPNTSRRDYTIADDSRATRRLEAFTGVNDNWVPKQEKYPLFEPMKNLTYVQGMPVFTDYMDDRYLASNKNNNGNLPFENNVFLILLSGCIRDTLLKNLEILTLLFIFNFINCNTNLLINLLLISLL